MNIDLRFPIKLDGRHFGEHKYEYYAWLRENAPVYKSRVSVLTFYLLSRYQDCAAALADTRLFRNRATALGGRRFALPLPKSAAQQDTSAR